LFGILTIEKRYYIIQTVGDNLRDGEQFAKLSQHVLDSFEDERDEELYTKLLANCYRYQGITGIYKDSPDTVENCKKWTSILINRIIKYNERDDVETLPISYNETGMALMRLPDKDEAYKMWTLACEGLDQVTSPEDLPFPSPWMHRAIISSHNGDLDKAESIILPVLQRRQDTLGLDDTKTHE
jgi:hypothetical protein